MATTCRLSKAMDSWKQSAADYLDRLEAEGHPEEFFHALRELLSERYRRGPGKPKGTQVVDDTTRLQRLFDLLRLGEVTDPSEAVRRVEKKIPATPRSTPASDSGASSPKSSTGSLGLRSARRPRSSAELSRRTSSNGISRFLDI